MAFMICFNFYLLVTTVSTFGKCNNKAFGKCSAKIMEIITRTLIKSDSVKNGLTFWDGGSSIYGRG